MSYWIGLPLLLLVALMEASILPLFRIAGVQPNLMLVLLTAWLMVRGSGEAYVLIPIGGVLLGLVDGAPMGTALLAIAPVAILHEIRGTQLTDGGLVLTIASTIVMTLVYHAVYFGVFALSGAAGPALTALERAALPACLLNVAVLLPIYLVLTISVQNRRRASYA